MSGRRPGRDTRRARRKVKELGLRRIFTAEDVARLERVFREAGIERTKDEAREIAIAKAASV